MRQRSCILVFTIALSLGAVWIAAADDADSVKLVTTGRIDKIDTKHNTFQFKFMMDPEQPVRRPVQNAPYPGRVGGRRGGRIGGYPPRNTTEDNSKEVKVFVSDATRVKGAFNSMQFSDLKSGDRVTVTATHRPHGDDLDAEVIARN